MIELILFQVVIKLGTSVNMMGEYELPPIVEFYKAENEADVVIHILRNNTNVSLKDISINYICREQVIKTINKEA